MQPKSRPKPASKIDDFDVISESYFLFVNKHFYRINHESRYGRHHVSNEMVLFPPPKALDGVHYPALYELEPRPRAAWWLLCPLHWPQNACTLVSVRMSSFYAPREQPQEGLLPEAEHFSPPLLQIHHFTQRCFNGEQLIKLFALDFFFPLQETVFGAYTALLSGGLTVLKPIPPQALTPSQRCQG